MSKFESIFVMFQWHSGWWCVWRKRFWRPSRLFCRPLLPILYMAELTASLQSCSSSTLGTSTHTRPLIVCYRGLCLVCVWLIWYFCVFRSLVLLSEWRAVVSELIGLCYRMSDVVSPVVQSSSPEGLIPMDTESGKCI